MISIKEFSNYLFQSNLQVSMEELYHMVLSTDEAEKQIIFPRVKSCFISDAVECLNLPVSKRESQYGVIDYGMKLYIFSEKDLKRIVQKSNDAEFYKTIYDNMISKNKLSKIKDIVNAN